MNIKTNLLSVLMGMIISAIAMGGANELDDVRKDSENFVNSVDGCAFLDGYQCGDLIEDNFLSLGSQQKLISGNLLKAWHSALTDFQSQTDQTHDQVDLKHFKIGFTENDLNYIILFQGLLMPQVEEGEVTGLTRVTYGRTTKYWINKDTFKVEKRLFYK